MTERLVVQAVRSTGFAGVERYVCDVSNELSSRGWQVQVLGGDPARMVTELEPGVSFAGAATTAELTRRLCALGRVPLVHAHMTAAEMAAVSSRPLTRARVLSTRHFAGLRGSSPVARAGLRLLSRGLHTEVAISRFVAAAVEGSPTVVLNGVRPEPPAAGGQQVLLIQRLEREKDTVTAVRAFSRSGVAELGWRLRIAGRGSEHAALSTLVEQQGLAEQVDLLGFVDDPGALRALGGVFLATAPAEPFGLSVVEAMAAGLAVVAADGGAHRETLADTGTYFPPGDVAACAELLRALATDPARRAAAGRAARARQQSSLSVVSHVDALEELYARMLR